VHTRVRSAGSRSRISRSLVLLLIVAIHAALLLLASRSVMRTKTSSDLSLVFLAVPDSARALAPAAAVPAAPRKPPPGSHDTQLVIVPAPQSPSADSPRAPIDWNAEAELAVKQHAQMAVMPQPRALDKHGAGADFNGGLGPDGKPKPEFAWDRSHTQRVESMEGGGILIHINDRCTLVLFPLPFVGCGIGKKPASGDLFEHMREAPADGR
jgi:hypothetical protein